MKMVDRRKKVTGRMPKQPAKHLKFKPRGLNFSHVLSSGDWFEIQLKHTLKVLKATGVSHR